MTRFLNFIQKNKVNTLPRISRICTKLGLDKTLYFILFHEFSPDGDVVMRGRASEKLGESRREGDCTEKAAYGFRQLFVIITCVV